MATMMLKATSRSVADGVRNETSKSGIKDQNNNNNNDSSSNSSSVTNSSLHEANCIGKSSNSSNETVIVRDSQQQEQPVGFKRVLTTDLDTEQSSGSISRSTIETVATTSVSKTTTNIHQVKMNETTNKKNGILKSFLLFKNHLNPFHLHHGNRENREQRSKRLSLDLIESNIEQDINYNEEDEQVYKLEDDIDNRQDGDELRDKSNNKQTKFYYNLNLFNLARKYFGLRHSQSNNLQMHQQQPTEVKSAPVTPVKWRLLEGENRQLSNNYPIVLMTNGNCQSYNHLNNDIGINRTRILSTIEDESPRDDEETSIAASVEKDRLNNNNKTVVPSFSNNYSNNRRIKPSVRFVDGQITMNNDYEETLITDKFSLKVQKDQAVQTTTDLMNSNEQQSLESPSLATKKLEINKETNVVGKLFKIPATASFSKKEDESEGEIPMSTDKFRQHGYSLIDYISNYLDTIDKRRVTPLNIEPGYLKELIEPNAPEKGETFSEIMHDFENHIMCGITHWQHPHFHAYFPAGNAYSSILADMLSDALGCVGFSWAASPAYTELEIIMLDWMGKMIGLPDEFLCLSHGNGNGEASSGSNQEATTTTGSKGGGVIQGSASECVLVNLLAARHWAIDKLRKKYPKTPDGMLLTKLIGYCSKEAHSCVEKAAMIGFIRMRALDTDEKHSLRGETLQRAIECDLANGLEPFIVCATLGTTSCVSFDNLEELGKICLDYDIWLHVDAAYAGSALICPEFKYLMKGIELATSFNMNPNKWMLINFDCSLMWVKDRFKLTRAFVVDPLYLQHSFSDQAIDYRHWGIPLSRRFRALKLWFVIRNYGVEGLQSYIRNHVRLAKLFEEQIRQDKRFIITNEVVLGLVCFRLVGSNALNQRLLSMINASGKLHMVPASLNGRYIIRFCVCQQQAQDKDIIYAYKCISDFATELFESILAGKERIRAVSQQNTVDVSSLSLQTQQSASADRLDRALKEQLEQQGKTDEQQQNLPKSQAEMLEQTTLNAANQLQSVSNLTNSIVGLSGNRLPMTVNTNKSQLIKQAPVNNNVSLTTSQTNFLDQQQQQQTNGEEEDLEQEIVLDSLASIDGYDFDLDDDDLIETNLDQNQTRDEQTLQSLRDPMTTTTASGTERVGVAQLSATNSGSSESSKLARHWYSRAHTTHSATTATGQELEEAADEVQTLADRRNRMSLRYKREFFVRMVSDPRVYRASISGDINAHASCCSLGSGQSAAQKQVGCAQNDNCAAQQQQQQNQEQ